MKRILIGIGALAAGFAVERYLWAVFALPSITTLIVVADLLARRFLARPILHPRDTAAIFTFIAGAGIVLYGASLGVIPLDVYRAGFSPLAVIALAIAGVTIAPRAPRAAAVALLVLVTFELHLLSSRNLFDYVIDPLITVAVLLRSIAWLGAHRERFSDAAPSIAGSGTSRDHPP